MEKRVVTKSESMEITDEYIKNPHDFIVGANNPEVVFARDAELGNKL